MHRVLCLAALMFSLAPATAGPPGSATFTLPRQSLDGGAATSSSANFELTGAIGQADASAPAGSASFSVTGGFHRQSRPDLLLRDGFESP